MFRPENTRREHLDPNSYSWCLMRYAIIMFIHYRLITFLPQIGIELSGAFTTFLYLYLCVSCVHRNVLFVNLEYDAFAANSTHKHIFFFLPPSTVPGWIVLTSADDRAMKFWGGFISVAQHNLCALSDTNTAVLVLSTLLTTSNLLMNLYVHRHLVYESP